MEPVGAISAIGQAIDAVKALKDFERKFDAAQFKLQIADHTAALADAKLSVVGMQEELNSKNREIENLKANFRQRTDTIAYDGFRYEIGADGKPTGYPYCNRCMTIDGVMIKVEAVPMAPKGGAVTVCPQCDSKYSAYKAESIMHIFDNLISDKGET